MRTDVSVVVSSDAYFSSDRIGVKATLRASFGYPTPKSIARIRLAAT